jgi:hypothetical protein
MSFADFHVSKLILWERVLCSLLCRDSKNNIGVMTSFSNECHPFSNVIENILLTIVRLLVIRRAVFSFFSHLKYSAIESCVVFYRPVVSPTFSWLPSGFWISFPSVIVFVNVSCQSQNVISPIIFISSLVIILKFCNTETIRIT